MRWFLPPIAALVLLAAPGSGAMPEDWAYNRFTRPAVPTVKDRESARTPVDAFLLVKLELRPGSCLIKQGHHSVVCTLDLRGCTDELAVLSGRASTGALMRELIERHGAVPEAWLPLFLSQYRSLGA